MARSSQTPDADSESASPQAAGRYTVVARRYRPQTFDELVGQEHVARALAGAIESDRVGHAYLFTGARGVGKTSAARILAKALNCEHGPTPTPCNKCDICLSIAAGDDVDVLEIDGASNRGIEEMRELRQNVNVRPSRARYKIYIIDEVHMLTREAFNALLKTLEEPPEHVKFIFCTTEVEKIPITILSRCQRFDFAGIRPSSIRERLRQIVTQEGATADDAALDVLARRAAGSMRDSQSLLEQLLGLGEKHISVADVHRMLGSVADEGLLTLAKQLAARDAAGAIRSLDAALGEGVDVGQLLTQLLGFFRDAMVLSVGGPAELLMQADEDYAATAGEVARSLGTETVLAAMQIIEQTMYRLRQSTHGRVLAELALVRVCQLENLEEVADVIASLRDGEGGSPPKKKLNEPPTEARATLADRAPSAAPAPSAATRPAASAASSPPPGALSEPLTSQRAGELWREMVERLNDLTGAQAGTCESVAVAAPGRLVVTFAPQYNSRGFGDGAAKLFCERPEQTSKLESAFAGVAGQRFKIEFRTRPATQEEERAAKAPAQRPAPHDRLREVAKHPLLERARELFQATPFKVDEAPQ